MHHMNIKLDGNDLLARLPASPGPQQSWVLSHRRRPASHFSSSSVPVDSRIPTSHLADSTAEFRGFYFIKYGFLTIVKMPSDLIIKRIQPSKVSEYKAT